MLKCVNILISINLCTTQYLIIHVCNTVCLPGDMPRRVRLLDVYTWTALCAKLVRGATLLWKQKYKSQLKHKISHQETQLKINQYETLFYKN